MEELRGSASEYTTEELIALAEREGERNKKLFAEYDEYWKDREAWWNELNVWLKEHDMPEVDWRYPGDK